MELRQDPATRVWILTGKIEDKKEVRDSRCPFCRGNEKLTPETINAFYEPGGEWTVRVFPDKSPVFQIEGGLDSQADGMFDKMRNIGAHEVIVETPKHVATLTSLHEAEIVKILKMYRKRVSDLKKDKRFKYVLISKNHGRLAGSSIDHLHSYIIATPVIPTRLERELRWAKKHYDIKNRCIFCDIIYQESRQKVRTVFKNRDFITLCPFASRFPYETWILPVVHSHSFENSIEDESIANSLAGAIKVLLSKIERIASSYRMVFHISPNESSFRTIKESMGTLAEDFHWHIEILPIMQKTNKLQREEEFYINQIPPEEAAKKLREV